MIRAFTCMYYILRVRKKYKTKRCKQFKHGGAKLNSNDFFLLLNALALTVIQQSAKLHLSRAKKIATTNVVLCGLE